MTILWVILAVVVALGAGLAIVLRRLLRPDTAGSASHSMADLLSSGRRAPETYRPMTRLFAEQDFAFLSGWPGSDGTLVRRLRRQRAGVLRLYLRELRADFQRLHGFARALVPTSADPEFAATVFQCALRFHALWALVALRCSLGWFVPLRAETTALVAAMDRLRETARLALAPPQAQRVIA